MATHKPVTVNDLYGDLSPSKENEKWYVIYTKPKEKKLADYAMEKAITYYLPLKTSLRTYQYRKVEFTKPLFPGYLFVKCDPSEKQALIISGHIVSFLKVMNENELLNDLQQIYLGNEAGAEYEEHDYIEKGTFVEILSGPFKGMKGIVDESQKNKIILSVNMLHRAVSVDIKHGQVKILKEK